MTGCNRCRVEHPSDPIFGGCLTEQNIPMPMICRALDVEDYGDAEQIAALVRAHWKVPRGPMKDLTLLDRARRHLWSGIPPWLEPQ